MELSNGIRFCYSGDTRPSNHLIRAASQGGNGAAGGVSLLLHEGTFEDDIRGKKEAQKKKHSTVLEAMDVARRMQAKVCLLTHFSQRYPKAPPRLDMDPNRSSQGCHSVEPAFAVDGMWIPLTDPAIAKLPILSNLVQQLLQK
jgi:ribonuclease Z